MDMVNYDVCIIGSGPAGLAALSAMREDYSINVLSDTHVGRAIKKIRQSNRSSPKRICVVDPNPNWLDQWERNFKTLDILFLRSPALAHSCYFDQNALLAYAISEGREDELLESGCSDIKSLKGTILPSVGLWKLPSTKLFLDFSRSLAKSLTHVYIQGKVVDIQESMSYDSNTEFRIFFNGENQTITSKSVILATGAVGRPIIPKSLEEVSSSRIFHWQELNRAISTIKKCSQGKRNVLVIGGGLTAVQTAHKLVRSCNDKNTRVVLCSRKNLVERHFDIPVKWFDYREAHYHQSQFYFEPEEERLKALRATRGGGTVPPIYMETTRSMEKIGYLTRKTGNVSVIKKNEDDDSLMVRIENKFSKLDDEEFQADVIVLACGLQPNCFAHPLVQKLQKRWPQELIGGFPLVSEDLQWAKNLHVVGGLASLSVGPDASNLMGISRAAETVSNALNSKTWLRENESNVLSNPFEAFMDDSDEED